MNKTVKWILIGLGVVIVLLVGVKLLKGSSKDEIKITAEKAEVRNIRKSK